MKKVVGVFFGIVLLISVARMCMGQSDGENSMIRETGSDLATVQDKLMGESSEQINYIIDMDTIKDVLARDFDYSQSPIGHILEEKVDIKVVTLDEGIVVLSIISGDVGGDFIDVLDQIEDFEGVDFEAILMDTISNTVFVKREYSFTCEIIGGDVYIDYSSDFLSDSLCGMEKVEDYVTQRILDEVGEN